MHYQKMQTANPGVSASEAVSKILVVSILLLREGSRDSFPGWPHDGPVKTVGKEDHWLGAAGHRLALGCRYKLSSSCTRVLKRVRHLVDSDLFPLSCAVCFRGWPQPSQIWDKPTDTGAPRRRERESHHLQGSCSQKLLMIT